MIRNTVSPLVPDAVLVYKFIFNFQKFFQTQENDLPILPVSRSVYLTPVRICVITDGDFFIVAKEL